MPQSSLLPYIVPVQVAVPVPVPVPVPAGTEVEVAAMDDLQFMEVLLDNDPSLGDTEQEDASKEIKNLQGPVPSPLMARLNYTTASLGVSHVPFSDPAQPRAPSSDSLTARKRARDQAPPVSENEGEKQRRRTDRNLREQQRSHKITEQISYLRDLLADANVHFKPDKYSTLISVVEYIRQLQSRSSFLDEEHKKLLQTISTTDEVVKSSYYHTTADGPALTTSSDFLADAPGSFALEEDHSVFVRGVNYRNIFKQCSIALAVASIDGRFMDCNTEFEVLTGYERDELLSSEKEEATEITADPVLSQDGVPSTVTTSRRRNLSLFNLLGREDMEQVFRAMSCMLKRPVDLKKREVGNQTNRATDGIGSRNQNFDCWSGYVTQTRLVEDKVIMNVSLVRSPQGRPKFFQCALTSALEAA